MSGPIEDLLQQCLDGYEAGMSPEECLSAFPDRRAELEPLLRQALILRVNFAHAPSEAFAARGRERLLFAAGRDVKAAFGDEPRRDFVMDARQRLIMAGGAAVQESLRNVPPPRLPFWMNARARILEAASRPQPKPVARPVAVLRAPAFSMSLAAIVAAVAIAGAAFFSTQSSQPSVAAELALIERQVLNMEQQQAAGIFISPNLLNDLTRRTNELAAKLNDDPSSADAQKLQPLINRQWEVIQFANSIKPPAAEPREAQQQLQQAQQQLHQAEEKVQVLAAKQAVAPAEQAQQPKEQPSQPAQAQQPKEPASQPAQAQQPKEPASQPAQAQQQPAQPAPQPPAQQSQPKPPTLPPSSQSQAPAGPVPAGQVRIRVISDTTAGLSWVEIRTAEAKFAAPASWSLVGVVPDANGIATIGSGSSIGFTGPDAAVIFNPKTFNFDGVFSGQAFPSFQRIDNQELIARAGAQAAIMRHMVDSLEIIVPPVTRNP